MHLRTQPRRRPPHRLGVVAGALTGLLVAGCSLGSIGSPIADLLQERGAGGPSRPSTARSQHGPYTLDLGGPRDHVAQFDDSWCVGASMQMMINIIDPGAPDRTRATQQHLYRYARKVSPWTETRPGASVYGWAEGLERLGYGSYAELAADSRQAALKLAARQMRQTNRPVGLLVWAGAHAWVMSGFKATADPALTDEFSVTHVWIEDPWAGRVSRRWGRGLEPHTLLTARQLRAAYVRYASIHRPQYGREGRFVVVAPTA